MSDDGQPASAAVGDSDEVLWMSVDPTSIGGARGLPSWVIPAAEQLLRARDVVVPFVGSGVSRHAGMPHGRALAALIQTLPLAAGVDIPPAEVHDCLRVADRIVDRDAAKGEELRQLVADHLQLASHGFTITETLMAIVHAPARVILTFNYDLLIEAAAEAAGVPYISLTIEDIDELQPIIAGTLPDVLTIVHLHGSVQHPPSIVLDSNSYHQHMTRVHTKNLFQALARMKTLLFLGLALDEEYFLVWLQELGLRSVRHVYVCPDTTADGSHVCSLESGSLTGTTRDPSARSRAHRRFSQAAVAWPPSAGATQHDDRQAATCR